MWSQGLISFQHRFQKNQQIAFASHWRIQAPAQPSPSGRCGMMGLLQPSATRNLPGEGRFTVSQISVTAPSFSNSAVNIRPAITACTKKKLLLIDCTACCYSAKNVLLIFCFHQIFHLKYESGNEAVSCISKKRQSCCSAFGSAASVGMGAWNPPALPAWVLQDLKWSYPWPAPPRAPSLAVTTTKKETRG